MLPEITLKDDKIYSFLTEFRVASRYQLRKFIGYNVKNEKRLLANDRITVEGDIVKVKGSNISKEEQENVVLVLNVLLDFIDKGYIVKSIMDIKSIDLPYYAIAKAAKAEVFIYFTIIRKGREAVRGQLIDNDNRGNVVLILEDKDQLQKLKMNTKVSKLEIIAENSSVS